MTWQEFAVSRQFLFEERVGAEQREISRELRSREDASFAASRKALQAQARAR